ncbi:hypothetical protein [Thermomonas carbonis]|uniref:Uncharacterized protein n=1 Tax=Thermomonas carbonis TaxID=1463158 RepID=A0A7G9SQM3_9GAMM|nr:hypothetical protein [Thermomonas carbonis]QNN70148.1 hypothetical protein H9L16_00360 [Thermomonas carbonis]GHB98083.1 hypothetical protein GCM10010080_07970 [Thermomonas carbonis]
MSTRKENEPSSVPTAHPESECNTGYAEPKPKDKAQAQIPGAKPEPDAEEGGLEHDPDPTP